jgi:enoyl-CoA hydratase
MPEVGIGFFPDVGAAWFLPRLARRAGVYFALTGLRADAGDALALGLAQTFAPSAAIPALTQALEGDEPVEAALARFAAPAPRSALISAAEDIEVCFSQRNRQAILDALSKAETTGRAFAASARAAMLEKSPTSQAIALRQMEVGARVDFDEALRMDYRIVSRICRGHDFYEGVRAVIVDKDNRPQWSPSPSRLEVDAYFASLGGDELILPARGA